jgi:hypothetical protein
MQAAAQDGAQDVVEFGGARGLTLREPTHLKTSLIQPLAIP